MPDKPLTIEPKYVVDKDGLRSEVVLSVQDYQALLERMENLEDALALDEAIRTGKGFVPLSRVGDKLKRDGKLGKESRIDQ